MTVFDVQEGGITGQRLGAASLVEPDFGLVHPPLNRRLAARARRLRVGTKPAGSRHVEIIEVARTHVLADAPEIVLLELASESIAFSTGFVEGSFDRRNMIDVRRNELIAGLRKVLASVPPEPPEIPVRRDPVKVIRKVLGLRR